MVKPILCLDFDGVIHSYSSGWKGADIVSDPPVPGAIPFIVEALDHFSVCIYSSRSNQPGGIEAMQDALKRWSLPWIEEGLFRDDPMLGWINLVRFPKEKPAAMVTLDDRAITFDGTWPAIDRLKEFKPWNKQ